MRYHPHLQCEMTCSDNGKSPTGQEHFWKCGKRAKATILCTLRNSNIPVCGIHARAHDKTAVKTNRPPSKPLQ